MKRTGVYRYGSFNRTPEAFTSSVFLFHFYRKDVVLSHKTKSTKFSKFCGNSGTRKQPSLLPWGLYEPILMIVYLEKATALFYLSYAPPPCFWVHKSICSPFFCHAPQRPNHHVVLPIIFQHVHLVTETLL